MGVTVQTSVRALNVVAMQIVCGKTWQHHGNHGEINVWICESVK